MGADSFVVGKLVYVIVQTRICASDLYWDQAQQEETELIMERNSMKFLLYTICIFGIN